MTQIVDKKLKNMCNHCQSLLNKPCAWLSLGNEYCDEIMEIQKELEELREDNYAYHQLMKMQNKREYRSKFLKEFQEEFGENVFPDYDEIYKRYDKVKKENKKQKEVLDKIKKYILENCEIIRFQNVDKVGKVDGSKILKILEEIE